MKESNPSNGLSPRAEQLLLSFEAAWERGETPDPAAYWLGDDSLALLIELLHVDVERRGKAHLPIQIETQLRRFPALKNDPQASIDLILAEYRWRLKRQEPGLSWHRFLDRFPAQRQAIVSRMEATLTTLTRSSVAAPLTPESYSSGPSLASNVELVRVLEEGQFLSPASLEKLKAELQKRFRDPGTLARELTRFGWLTPFQTDLILQGKARELSLGPYVLQELLGSGGMGRVFKAWHKIMQRPVALKLIRVEHATDKEAVGRFRREVAVTARLSHPNIVTAFDAAEIDGALFLAMEFVDGKDLGVLVKESGKLAPGDACDYIRQAALGLQHSHEKGLVHRDIKPSNLMVARDEKRTVKILDLGLARLHQTGDEHAGVKTQLGAVMGTPDFMSPEQAIDTHRVDIRSDIYSLGCTLYFLLAGEKPFPAATIQEKIAAHLQEQPAPIEQHCADLPSGLGEVVRTMMAKKPKDRFQTPAEAAEALEPFCVARSNAATAIMARKPSRKSVSIRRTESVAGLNQTATDVPVHSEGRGGRPWWLACAAAALLLISVAFWLFSAGPGQNPDPEPPVRDLTDASWSLDRLGPQDIAPGLRKNLLNEVIAVVGDARAFHHGAIKAAAVSPNGKLLATAGGNEIIIADATTLETIRTYKGTANALAFSPDSARLAGAYPAWVRDVATGAVHWEKEDARKEQCNAVAFSADGKRLMTSSSDGTAARVWDGTTGLELFSFDSELKTNPRSALSPDGRLLFSVAKKAENGIWLVDLVTELPLSRIYHGGGVEVIAFSSDGKLAVSGNRLGQVGLWSVDGKATKLLRSVKPERAPVLNLTFCRADTLLVASYRSGLVQVINVADASIALRLNLGPALEHVCPSPDGKRLFTTGKFSQRVSGWDLGSGEPAPPTAPHDGPVSCVAFSPDGRYLLSGDRNGTARQWDLKLNRESWRIVAKGIVNAVAYNRDGAQCAVGGTGLQVLNNQGQEVKSINTGSLTYALGFSRDGDRLLAAGGSPTVGVWSIKTGKSMLSLKEHQSNYVYAARFSPDDATIITGDLGKKEGNAAIRTWSAASGKLLQSVDCGPAEKHGISNLRLSPDGKYLYALERQNATIKAWDLSQSLKPRAHDMPPKLDHGAYSMALSADGDRLLALKVNGHLLEWQTSSGKLTREWRLNVFGGGLTGQIDLAPDGRHVAVAMWDGRVWIMRLAGTP